MKPIHVKPSLYAYYFEALKEIALKYGYNLVLHGSLNRDLDLIAIPWQETIGNKDLMIDEFTQVLGGVLLLQNGERSKSTNHGRMWYIININRSLNLKHHGMVTEIIEHEDPQYYLDISVIPVI